MTMIMKYDPTEKRLPQPKHYLNRKGYQLAIVALEKIEELAVTNGEDCSYLIAKKVLQKIKEPSDESQTKRK